MFSRFLITNFESPVIVIRDGQLGDRPFTRPPFYQKSYNLDLLPDLVNKFD